MTILEKVTALLGEGAVLEPSTDRVPRIAPGSPDAVALLLGTAHQEGWRVRIEGAGTWLQSDAPADLALTTRRLDRVPAVEPADLTATAEAGIGLDQLRQQLGSSPIAPPGWALIRRAWRGARLAPSSPPRPPARCDMASVRSKIISWA